MVSFVLFGFDDGQSLVFVLLFFDCLTVPYCVESRS
jgi:hypothetical protein